MATSHSYAVILFILFIFEQHLVSSQFRCRCLSNNPSCWPSASAWQSFNTSVNGRILIPRSSATPCTSSRFDASACNITTTHWMDSQWRSDQVGAMQYFNWENSSCSITNFNSICTQGSIPVIAVDAIWPEHIQTTIRFAANNNLRLVMKTTGHDLLGRSTAFGSLLLWLHNMKNISLIPQYSACGVSISNAVRVTAGVQWGDLYTWLDAYNLTVLGGTSKSVAAAGGYIQGGGHSPLSRWGGMPTDQVLEYDVITADEQRRTASPCQNQDLYWALSGGGPGTYGAVVSIVLKTFRSPSLVVMGPTIMAPNDTRYAQLVRDFFRLIPSLADAGWSGYFVLKDRQIDVSLLLPNGTVAAANAILTAFGASNPDLEYTNTEVFPFPSLYQLFVNVLMHRDPTGYNGIVGSRLLPETVVRNQIDNVAQTFFQMRGSDANYSTLTVAMVSGGAAARSSGVNNSINPAWRNTMLHVFYGQAWLDQGSVSTQQAIASEVDRRVKLLDNFANGTLFGCYMNEADPNEPNWQVRFFGSQARYNQLKNIKQKYDPNGLFICKNCVGSDDWTSDLNCQKSSAPARLRMAVSMILLAIVIHQ